MREGKIEVGCCSGPALVDRDDPAVDPGAGDAGRGGIGGRVGAVRRVLVGARPDGDVPETVGVGVQGHDPVLEIGGEPAGGEGDVGRAVGVDDQARRAAVVRAVRGADLGFSSTAPLASGLSHQRDK